MAGSKYIKKRTNRTKDVLINKLILNRERKLIISNYDFIECKISKNKLICLGKTKPTEFSIEYEFKIEYGGVNSPKVLTVNPVIEYSDDIHMFPKDNSLCLYHPKTDNFKWDFKRHQLYDTIIPWTLEWFVYYELYLISGKWEHHFVPHKRTKSL